MSFSNKILSLASRAADLSDTEVLVESPPEWGAPVEVADGILWVRLPLPFALDHVNVYLIRGQDGWALLDTGVDDARIRSIWEELFSGPLAGERLERVIVSHYHPDHVGLAGWLAAKFNIPLHMSATDYLLARGLSHPAGSGLMRFRKGFLESHGVEPELASVVTERGQRFLDMCSPLPGTFRRLLAGMSLHLGGTAYEVLTGGGHAPEQVMLYGAKSGAFFSTDQVLQRISPNVGITPLAPDDDTLDEYLRSLGEIRERVASDVLVLPCHGLPFKGLHQRIDELSAHHHRRCDRILEAVADRPMTVGELLPVLFPRPLDPQQRSFAFAEALAHVNYLVARERLQRLESEGIYRYSANG
ncbi:MBL fold metallo-hydrolase [Chelativorans sp. Marseille-P2723]|uniref:MBL fold metallo-hydrolase n=1 Tax=Chelativorans sp. Marseille-P2723 TaxID=2709133 RepID=UPI001FEF40D8|nr:MBL fold metallo-hydrolase [Chelativorans sp. Marseille-P2723]